jgi:hypothetical protein
MYELAPADGFVPVKAIQRADASATPQTSGFRDGNPRANRASCAPPTMQTHSFAIANHALC